MTSRGNDLYLHVFEWPEDDQLVVDGLVTPITTARMLGDRVADRTLAVEGNRIDLSGLHPFPHATVIRLEFEQLPVIDRSIHPDARGVLTLGPDSAELSGPNLRVEQYPDTDGEAVASLGYWNATDATATWTVRLEPGTTYEIELDYACAEG